MAVTNSLQKNPEGGRPQKMQLSVYLSVDAVKRQINQVVGKNADRFVSSIISAVQANPVLKECTNQSILSAALLGQSLNLSPSPQLGMFYLVPYDETVKDDNGKIVYKMDANGRKLTDQNGRWIPEKVKKAQFQLGYKGYVQLATRSGYYKRLNVVAIKEGELNRYDPLDEEIDVTLIEDDIIREETPTIGYYAMFEYANGFRKTLYWSKQKMMRHADRYSKAFHADILPKLEAGEIPEDELWKYSSFWYKDFDGMAMKTMLRQLISKWGIMSIEMQEAYEKDTASMQEENDMVETEEETIVEEQEFQEVQTRQKDGTSEKAQAVQDSSKAADDVQSDVGSGEYGQQSFF